MKLGQMKCFILFLLLVAVIIGYYQQKQQEKHAGLDLVPEQTKDIPLYPGLEAESPMYKIKGNHWAEIMQFYEEELPENGWSRIMVQESKDSAEDGAGFLSQWEKKGTTWVLSISGGYFKASDETEVIFKKTKPLKAIKWIETDLSGICINEQPDRSDDCYQMTDKQTIEKVSQLINSAPEAESDPIYYNDKSVINFGALTVTVYYDLEKGIYFVSDRGAKWMKPEREFFELTRISKEY